MLRSISMHFFNTFGELKSAWEAEIGVNRLADDDGLSEFESTWKVASMGGRWCSDHLGYGNGAR